VQTPNKWEGKTKGKGRKRAQNAILSIGSSNTREQQDQRAATPETHVESLSKSNQDIPLLT